MIRIKGPFMRLKEHFPQRNNICKQEVRQLNLSGFPQISAARTYLLSKRRESLR